MINKKTLITLIFAVLLCITYQINVTTDTGLTNSNNDKIIYEGSRVYTPYYTDNIDLSSVTYIETDVITIELESDIMNENLNINDKRDFYENQNENFIERLDFVDKEDVSYSKYAPFIRIYVEDYEEFMSEIEILVNLEDVINIYLGSESTMQYVELDNYYFDSGGFNDDIVIEGGDGGGSSDPRTTVKVGIIDAGNIDINLTTRLSSVSITPMNPNQATHSHASSIADIIVNVFNDNSNIELYTSYVLEPNVADIYDAVDWQLLKEVDIINMSAGTNCTSDLGSYDSIAKFVDYIVDEYGVIFVAAAGQTNPLMPPECTWEDHYVVSPAIGYNIIAVGAIDSENEIWGPSSYWEDSYYISKPNLVANYSNYVNSAVGTSNSSPRVTGAIAKLMSYHEILKGNPSLVMSVIHTSSNGDIVTDPKDDDLINLFGFKEKSGAGKLDYSQANYIVDSSKYMMTSITDNYIGSNLTVLEMSFYVAQNYDIKVSFATMAKMFFNNNQYDSNGFTDYQILLYKGSELVESVNIDRNYGLFTFTTTSGMSEYTIKVVQRSSFPNNVDSEVIAVSYSIKMN